MNKERITLCFDPKILELLKQQAKDNGMSVSAYLTMLVNNKVGK